jgi:membrane protein
VVTSLLFTLGKILIAQYLGTARVGTAFGAAGFLVIMLVWINYSAQIIFLGAEFTQVYAHQHGAKITPDEVATPL